MTAHGNIEVRRAADLDADPFQHRNWIPRDGELLGIERDGTQRAV
jgi:hypothetical protein